MAVGIQDGYMQPIDTTRLRADSGADIPILVVPTPQAQRVCGTGPLHTLTGEIKVPRRHPGHPIKLSTYLITAWGLIVAKYTRGNDVLLGTINFEHRVAKEEPNHPQQKFPIVSVRLKADPDTTVARLIQAVQEQEDSRIKKGDIDIRGTEDPWAWRGSILDLRGVLSLKLCLKADENLAPLDLQTDRKALPKLPHPLVVECDAQGGLVRITLTYDNSAVSSARADYILHEYTHTIRMVMEHETGDTVEDINDTDFDEEPEILRRRRESVAPLAPSVLHMLEDHGTKDHTIPSIDAWGDTFTYHELCDATFKLSEYLQTQGINPDGLFPISLWELRMQKLWADVLDVPTAKIRSTDNFFALGGDSMAVMRLVSKARTERISIKATDVFLGQTLEMMAALATTSTTGLRISHHRSSGVSLSLSDEDEVICQQILKVKPHTVEKFAFGTNFQAWCILHSSLESGGWCKYLTCRLGDDVNMSDLMRACHMLVERHEALRTRFVVYRGKFLRAVMKFHPDDYPVTPVSVEPPIGERIFEMTRNAGHASYPYVQFFLDQERGALTLRINHALLDGLSMSNIQTDLSRLYAGQELPPAKPFSEYIECAQAMNNARTVVYWRHRLEGSDMTCLVRQTSPLPMNIQDRSLSQTIPAVRNAAPLIVLNTAWSLVLARVSQSDDVVFGSFLQNRHLELDGIEEIVGPCLNILPIRTKVESGSKLQALQARVQDDHLESLPYATLGFRCLIEQCTDWAKWSRFSSITQYQAVDASMEGLTLGGSHCPVDSFTPGADSADVWVVATMQGSQLKVSLEFSSAVMPEHFAQAMLTELCANIDLLTKSDGKTLIPDLSRPLDHQPALPLSPPALPPAATSKPAVPKRKPSPQAESKARELVHDAWEKVLGSLLYKTTSDESLLHTPFWAIWGDLVGLSQLAALYADGGAKVSVELLMENPTMAQQARLLATRI